MTVLDAEGRTGDTKAFSIACSIYLDYDPKLHRKSTIDVAGHAFCHSVIEKKRRSKKKENTSLLRRYAIDSQFHWIVNLQLAIQPNPTQRSIFSLLLAAVAVPKCPSCRFCQFI
jgi:hypothetical protein